MSKTKQIDDNASKMLLVACGDDLRDVCTQTKTNIQSQFRGSRNKKRKRIECTDFSSCPLDMSTATFNRFCGLKNRISRMLSESAVKQQQQQQQHNQAHNQANKQTNGTNRTCLRSFRFHQFGARQQRSADRAVAIQIDQITSASRSHNQPTI